MTPHHCVCSLKRGFFSATVLCLIFVIFCIKLWHLDMRRLFSVELFTDRINDANCSVMLQRSNFTTTGNWTPIYRLSDRLSMPEQPVPGLRGGFKPKCRLDAPCISVGTGWFGSYKSWEFFANDFYPKECDVRCHVVSDISQADAVVFHGRDLPANQPTWKRHPRQLWVYLNFESQHATQSRGLNVAKYRFYHTLFNVSSTFQSASAGSTPYGYIEALPIPVAPRLPDLALKKRLAYIVLSNCWGTFNNRAVVLSRLQSVMELDVYGGCGKLKLPRSPEAFVELGKKYYFYLSFENSFCKEYITEKFYKNALSVDAAPVAIGGLSRGDYEAGAPPNSFVYGPDFKTAKDLANNLRALAANTTAYLSLFAWRANYQIKTDHLLCGTCRALHDFASRGFHSGISTNLSSYFDVGKYCYPTNKPYLV